MVEQLISRLEKYKEASELLVNKYSEYTLRVHIEYSMEAINTNAPNATCEFFKLLNLVKKDDEFPVKGLDYNSMIEVLSTKKDEIEERIELSKENKELGILMLGARDRSLNFIILNAFDRINSRGQMPLMYLRFAKLKAGEIS